MTDEMRIEYEELRREFGTINFKRYMSGVVGSVCCNCGSTKYIEYHHVVPLALGGTNSLQNIVALCEECHLKAHKKVPRAIRGGRRNSADKDLLESMFHREVSINMHRSALKALAKESLTAAEMALFMYMAANLSYKTNIVSKGGGRPFKRSDLMAALKCSEGTMKRSIKALTQSELIKECRTDVDKCIFVNPYVCNKGERMNIAILEMFKDTKWHEEIQ